MGRSWSVQLPVTGVRTDRCHETPTLLGIDEDPENAYFASGAWREVIFTGPCVVQPGALVGSISGPMYRCAVLDRYASRLGRSNGSSRPTAGTMAKPIASTPCSGQDAVFCNSVQKNKSSHRQLLSHVSTNASPCSRAVSVVLVLLPRGSYGSLRLVRWKGSHERRQQTTMDQNPVDAHPETRTPHIGRPHAQVVLHPATFAGKHRPSRAQLGAHKALEKDVAPTNHLGTTHASLPEHTLRGTHRLRIS